MFQFTLNDPAATAGEKAVARDELQKLGVAVGKNISPKVSLQAACPVSIGDVAALASSSVTAAANCTIKVPPTSASVSVTWVQQSNGYYCGPASAFMALKQQGVTTSKDGAKKSLTQANLAGSTYLKTTSSGGTPWASKKMHATLNKWTKTSAWKATNAPASNSARVTALKSAFRANIGISKRTVLVNAVEYKVTSTDKAKIEAGHYNGHPNKTIGHWMVGYAYEKSGDTIKFADPATGLAGYKGAKKFSISTRTFAKFLNNGIVA